MNSLVISLMVVRSSLSAKLNLFFNFEESSAIISSHRKSSTINPATKHFNDVILSNAKNLAFSGCYGSFTEAVLSITTRFFAVLRMTCEGFRMTIIIVGLILLLLQVTNIYMAILSIKVLI
jgi:hypothetical protein